MKLPVPAADHMAKADEYAKKAAGYREEAAAWRDWLMRAVAGEPSRLQILYGIGGERRIPEVELDLPLTWQALPRLMRELGPARTKELAMACERFTSAEAERWGFVNHVHPDDQVQAASRRLAARLLSMDPLSLAMTKKACDALADLMVPKEVTWSDAELMLLAYRQQAAHRRAGNPER